jgi:hypothetical protein
MRRLAVAVLGVVAVSVAAPSYAVAVEPDYEMPFPCVQKWTGTTRTHHSPSPRAVDFNRSNDLGDLVTVSAPGTVKKVVDLGTRSYGRYVVVDHGNDRATLYAHLQKTWVVPGQSVDQGMVIGQVGATGQVSGPHLHYEQRLGSGVEAAVFHAKRFSYGSTQASANCPDVPVAGDWNGDGKAEVGTFRRTAKASFQRAGLTASTFGWGTDDAVVGDWDGDGMADLGVRRGKAGKFLLARLDGTALSLPYGALGDRPIAGDWDGDGKDEVGVYRPAKGQFLLRSATGATTVVALGSAGTLPVTGDWNGDRRSDVGVFDQGTATWTLRYLDGEGTSWVATVVFGKVGDLPVTGDWDGDGRTNLGVWSPATATYALRQGAATQPTARMTSRQFGTPRH